MYNYTVFGFLISANVEIPAYSPAERGCEPDICVTIAPFTSRGGDEWFRSRHCDENGRTLFTIAREENEHLFRYSDGCQFAISADGSSVKGMFSSSSSLEDLFTYLTGPILGFAIRLRGVQVLHAGAVSVNGGALLLAGPAGAGKSTLTAAMTMLGAALLSDNLVPLFEGHGCFIARPGYPRVRLWPDSSSLLFGSDIVLPKLTSSWDKRYFQKSGILARSSAPIRVIYLPRWGERTPPALEQLSMQAAAIALIASSYPEEFQERWMRARELEVIGRVVEKVPVVVVNRDGNTAPQEIAKLLLADFGSRSHLSATS